MSYGRDWDYSGSYENRFGDPYRDRYGYEQRYNEWERNRVPTESERRESERGYHPGAPTQNY